MASITLRLASTHSSTLSEILPALVVSSDTFSRITSNFSPVSVMSSPCSVAESTLFCILAAAVPTLASRSSIVLEICSADCLVFSDSVLISSATTAKPLPASPALAASIDAFRARRLV